MKNLMKKTALALFISAAVSGYAMAETENNSTEATTAQSVFTYTGVKPFTSALDVTSTFVEQNAFSLDQGSLTFRFSNQSSNGLTALLGVTNSATRDKYALFYIQRADEGDRFGIELRNGRNLIPNEDLRTDYIKQSEGEFRTVTYTFDKTARKISIYVDGVEQKVYNGDVKFFSSIPGLDKAYVGQAIRSNRKNWTYVGDVYHAGATPEVLTADQVKAEHEKLVEKQKVDYAEIIAERQAIALSREQIGAYQSEKYTMFKPGQQGSSNYRIPALLATKDGVVIAAIDKRNQHSADWGNIDTVIRRSLDGGKTWQEDQVLLDLVSQKYGNKNSAMLIDPVLVYDKINHRIIMIVDMFPETQGVLGSHNLQGEGNGYKKIQGKDYRLLTDDAGNQYTVRENGVVFDESNQPTEYRVVVEGNRDISFKDLGDLYKGEERLGNIFLQTKEEGNDTAPLRTQITSYLWMTYSDDNGETWSNPVDINPQVKEDWMRFMGTGPGTGIQLKDGTLVVPVYYTNGNGPTIGHQSPALIISKDGGKTWVRGESPNDRRFASSGGSRHLNNRSGELTESQVIELDNGDLKLFSRNHSGHVQISTSKDGGYTWQNNVVADEMLADPYSQLSVIKYSKRILGREIVIFANPHSFNGRVNGTIWLGFVKDDGSIAWTNSATIEPGSYAYNSLTELPDGSIGLLYETGSNINYVRLNLQELLWKDNIIYRDTREPENKNVARNNTKQDKQETYYKLGDGEMIKVGTGINQDILNVIEGTATLNQTADEDGNKQAYSAVNVKEGAVVRLADSDQMNLSKLTLEGGTLDLNGVDITVANSDEKTGLRSAEIKGNIINSNKDKKGTFTYQDQGEHTLEGNIGEGEQPNMDFVYNPGNAESSLTLKGNTIVNVIDVKTGKVTYTADTAHQADEIAVRSHANVVVKDNVKINTDKVTLEKDGNLTFEVAEDKFSNLFTKSIIGEGNLIKMGQGTLVLGGNIAHTGKTELKQGILHLADKDTVLSGSSLILQPNTRLTGSGEVRSKTIWADNSFVVPGFNVDDTMDNRVTDNGFEAKNLTFSQVENEGGTVNLRVNNTNSDLRKWEHDSIDIKGDFTTEKQVGVNLKLLGTEMGKSDINGNGQYDAEEGLSLIKIHGKTNRLDAFTLKSATDAINSAYQLALISFEKGVAGDYYDYQLHNKLVDESGNEVNKVVRKPVRAALKAQVPSYLVAGNAAMEQGITIRDSFLHNLWAKNKKGFYVTQKHSDGDYRSDLNFMNYGYAYDSKQNSTMFGGYLPVSENTELHGGLGFSTQKVTPKAVDGDSTIRYKTTSLMLAMHNEWDNVQLNSHLGVHWHRGKVSANGNEKIAQLKGKHYQVGTELGYRIKLGEFSLIPVVGVNYQQLDMKISDNSPQNLRVQDAEYKVFGQHVGSHLIWENEHAELGFAALYEHYNQNGGDVKVNNERFATGKLSDAMVVKANAEWKITPQLKLGVQASYRNGLSKAKFKQSNIAAKLEYQF